MNKYGPDLISFEYFKNAEKRGNQMSPDGKTWYPARHLAMPNLKDRLRLAWKVFVGEYDAFQWPKKESK